MISRLSQTLVTPPPPNTSHFSELTNIFSNKGRLFFFGWSSFFLLHIVDSFLENILAWTCRLRHLIVSGTRRSLSVANWFGVLAAAYVLYFAYISFFHPLHNVPGPFLAMFKCAIVSLLELEQNQTHPKHCSARSSLSNLSFRGDSERGILPSCGRHHLY